MDRNEPVRLRYSRALIMLLYFVQSVAAEPSCYWRMTVDERGVGYGFTTSIPYQISVMAL